MNCPVCSVELKITDRSGIEIDYCPKCRGIWLDKGELDKIIERSSKYFADEDADERPRKESYPDQRYEKGYDKGYGDRGYYDKDHNKYGHHKKRKNFLEDLFDF